MKMEEDGEEEKALIKKNIGTVVVRQHKTKQQENTMKIKLNSL